MRRPKVDRRQVSHSERAPQEQMNRADEIREYRSRFKSRFL
jgi:hypothetical protein